jgi:histidine phosphotransferase ChpT
MAKIALEMLDLAALLCSRVCHDVISPVGAIVNGLEVLEDESDSSMKEFALDLIKKSARQASAKLQFCRLAFGAAGSAGAVIDLGDAENVAKGFLNDDKLKLIWEAPRLLLPKNQVKLLLNLLLIATSAIPRGGVITAKVEMRDEEAVFIISSKGINARIPAKVEKLLIGEHESDMLDAHAVQPYYTGLLAQSVNRAIGFSIFEETVTITSKTAVLTNEVAEGEKEGDVAEQNTGETAPTPAETEAHINVAGISTIADELIASPKVQSA